MTANVYWVLQLKLKAGELDNAKALMTEMVEATQANEPGALAYEWFINEENQTCHIYERYADSDAVMTHMGTFGEKYAKRFMGVFQPTGVTVYGDANDKVVEAMTPLGASFYPFTAGFAR
jgi:quinol monooxygenase YgiN